MNEQDIIEHISENSPSKDQALKHLLEKFEHLKFNYGKKHNLSVHETEDAYIEAIEALWLGIEKRSFTPPLEQVFRTILRNKCVEQYRKRSKVDMISETYDVTDDQPNILDNLIDRESGDQALTLFNQLSEECREIFRLWFNENKSFKEIAKSVGYKSDAHARKRKFNCWNQWKKLVKGNPSLI